MEQKLQNELNAVYNRLEMKQGEILYAMHHRVFELKTGWYNGHYHRDENWEWSRDSYPIPVVEVRGYCDIEIQLDAIFVTTKLKRDTALNYSFEKFSAYAFEAYGVEDYLAEFYHAGQTIQEMKANIRASEEKEIGFSFSLPFDVEREHLYEFVKLLRREGFYY